MSRTGLQNRVTAAVMMADIDITSGTRPHATDAQYQAIADRLIEKVIGPERLLAAVQSVDERRDWGTSDHPMTEAEWRAAPRDGEVSR